MSTLNARANQAWNQLALVDLDGDPSPFYNQQAAFEEGWETGYKTARAEVAEEIAQAIEKRVKDLEQWPGEFFKEAAMVARGIEGRS